MKLRLPDPGRRYGGLTPTQRRLCAKYRALQTVHSAQGSAREPIGFGGGRSARCAVGTHAQRRDFELRKFPTMHPLIFILKHPLRYVRHVLPLDFGLGKALLRNAIAANRARAAEVR
jgi:hypothetical protein